MAKFELNKQALADVANQAVALRAQQMQALLDAVGESERGKDISTVKATLGARWLQEFERQLTDPQLSAWAEQLAGGGRVIVKPETVTL
jgi:hypothetical protein